MVTALLIFGLALALAFFNGANDVSKGIATLVGSGVTRLKTAVAWGAFWTVAGGISAAFAAQGLVKSFSGNEILSPLPSGPGFLAAVTAGALIWIWFATRTGFPVSTTHAITGALIGAGLIVVSFEGVQWQALVEKFLLPLAISPVLSLACMFALYPAIQFAFGKLNDYCICRTEGRLSLVNEAACVAAATAPEIICGKTEECAAAPAISTRLNLMDALHWFSAGATSFARGLNDTPKILALGLAASAALNVSTRSAFLLAALLMGVGSLIAGFRVTETLATRVTRMSPSEGLAANLITTLLVLFASALAVPVSTTHVSSGAIIGLGWRRDAGSVQWKTIREMMLAWIVTLPAAGLFAALIYWILRAAA